MVKQCGILHPEKVSVKQGLGTQTCICRSPFWYSAHPRAAHVTGVTWHPVIYTVYPKKYAHGFVVLCFVVVMQSFIMNSHEVFIHIHQGCFAGTWAIVRFPQCKWSKPDGYGKISQCLTTTKHSKAKTVCIFIGMYCRAGWPPIRILRPFTVKYKAIFFIHYSTYILTKIRILHQW